MRKTAALIVSVAALLALLPVGAQAATSDSIQKEMDRVAAAYGKVETQLAQTEARQTALEKEAEDAERIVNQKAEALKLRAGYMYKTGGFSNLMGQLLTSNSLGTFIKRMHYISVLGSSDAELVDEVVVNQARADEIRSQLAAAEQRQETLAGRLRSQREALEDRYADVRKAEEARRRAAQEQLRTKKIDQAGRDASSRPPPRARPLQRSARPAGSPSSPCPSQVLRGSPTPGAQQDREAGGIRART